MDTDVKSKREIFWESLNEYEEKTLTNAGFAKPEDFYELPLVSVVLLKDFGIECAADLFMALDEYISLDKECSNHTKKLFGFFYEDGDEYFGDEELLMFDELLFNRGYFTDEQVVHMRVKDFIDLRCANMVSALYDIMERYYRHYRIPTDISFKSKYDLKRYAELAFSEPRKQM